MASNHSKRNSKGSAYDVAFRFLAVIFGLL